MVYVQLKTPSFTGIHHPVQTKTQTITDYPKIELIPTHKLFYD
jgi:hypothetical protein